MIRGIVFMGLCGVLGASPATLDPVTLQLKWHHQFQFAGYYAAVQQGYYRDAGLDVTIREAEPGRDVVQEVVDGRAQYGVGGCSLLMARQAGNPVVVLGVVFQHSPVILMARARSGIATVQDLVGKRVMLEERTDELNAYLRAEGVADSSLIRLKHSFDPGDLVKGRVDCISAYSTNEPYFMKVARQDCIELSPRMGGIDFYGDNLFTSERELRGHPVRTRAFLEASMKGWKYAMAHPEELVDLILARYGQPRGRDYLLFEAQRMVPLLQPGMVEMGYMYRGRWMHIADTYAALGLLPPNFPLDGFLYDPGTPDREKHQRLLLALGGAILLGLVLGGTTLAFFQLNRKLRLEIATRVRAVEEKAGLEAQLHHAQKMKSLGVLAGGIAHDMNNVLAAILGYAESNLETQVPGTRIHRALDTIAKAAVRGGDMVRTLLNFARQRPAEERELDLNLILREEVEILSHTTLAKVQLDLSLDPDLRPVLGDPAALMGAVMNLCVNAVDAMAGQGRLCLRTANLGTDTVEVQVEDEGCGMAREVLEHAQDPFFTTKPQGSGTGLGLTMVYGIVEAHRGTLEIRSEVGRGTCVTLRFPACGLRPAAAPAPPAPAPDAPPSRLEVLVVDDDDLFRGSLLEILEALGHPAAFATRGEEAIALLEGGMRPSVLLLDMNMPGIGGAETLARVRALRPDLPVLIITGRPDQAVLDLVGAHERVSLLPKPFTVAKLQECLGWQA
ncbi:ABC transporter substrate-binding protein [Mesoterricola silvestris]|uniref:histidine kinase n=1 Tax=Mesoterricola silvestris TaxID=2927979 RepID=A0AA48K996_9BACT|nr:ABC transporter substrate-binding protein [Mesoterricola silvestris]BDU73206.1 hypothetical protein METEAL_23800 [Mesoterricola silvestris]